MIIEITIEGYFSFHYNIPIVDVRSPLEFQKGHIPFAYNIPLFSNEERAHIGTVYLKQSQEEAMKLGYEYVTPKLDYFIKSSHEIAPQNKVVVHCWRGGLRSHNFAEHLNSNGFSEVYVIKGGYKSFRNFVINSFNEKKSLYIIGGFTGSGKTEILKLLKADGLQVIDLEEIANHKGSVFGGIGNTSQPTSEQFENNLFLQWHKLDTSKPVCMEDESIKIGSVQIPNSLYNMMYEAPVFFLDIPKEERAKFLVEEYAKCSKVALANALQKISKRLGDLNTRKALEYLDKENYYEVALTALSYYDKAYLEVLSGRAQKLVYTIKLKDTNHRENANKIKTFLISKGPKPIT